MGKRGPEPIKINWDEFYRLVSMQCTQEEIAAWFGCSVDWLDKLCQRENGEKLSDIWDKRKFMGRVRLRKAQFDIMESGGPGAATMAIFLDKKMLPHEQPTMLPTPPPYREQERLLTFKEFCEKSGYFLPFQKQEEMRAFAIDLIVTRLLLGARGYGKTDYCTIMGVAYDLYVAFKTGKDMAEFTNLIITKSKARNTAIINEISTALEKNNVPLDKSNASVIRVEGLIGQDHSVEAITIKTSMRGRHPKRIVMDDPVTDEDTSDAMRTLVKKKYNEAMKLCKNIIIIGQPAHFDDLYAQLRNIIETMLVPHGSIVDLDEDLDAMKAAGVDADSIEMSYHLRVPESGAAIFSNIKYIDDFPTGDSVAYLDPSDGGDYTALTIFKGLFDGLAVQGHEWKKAYYHCYDSLVEVLVKRGVKRLCFETNKHGDQPIIQLRELLAPYGIGVVGRHSVGDKHASIEKAGSYAHQLYLSKQSDRSYTDHVVKYEYGAKFDDAPDSLARGLEWLGLLKVKK